MKIVLIFLALILILVVVKVIWVSLAVSHNSNFDSEKKDILSRRDFLLEKIIISPQQLIEEMPSIVGPQFQGDWALYSCSMLTAALVNTTLFTQPPHRTFTPSLAPPSLF